MSRLTAYIAALEAIQDQVQALIDDLKGEGLPPGEYAPEPDPVPVPDPIPDPVPDPIPNPAPAPVPTPTPTPTPVPIPPIIGATVAVNESDLVAKVANASPGSKIGMKDGRWNNVALSGNDVDVVAENPGAAIFDAVRVFKSNNVRLHNLTARPKGDTLRAANNVSKFGFQSDATASGTGLFGCRVYSHDDSAGHFGWDRAQWNKRLLGGVAFYGGGCTVDGFYGEAVNFGVSLIGKNNIARNVHLCGVSGDGFRVNNDGNTINRVYATDFVLIDSNHPDGCQTFGKVVNGKNTLIDGLAISEFVLVEFTQNPTNPLRAESNAGLQPFGIVQGIGFHNPPYANISIDKCHIETGHGWGLKATNIQGLDVIDFDAYNIHEGTPLATKSNFPKINVTGGNLNFTRSSAGAWEAGAANALGQNGNTLSNYPAVKKQWAVDLMASLPN